MRRNLPGLLICLILAVAGPARAVGISIQGHWTLRPQAADLLPGPGLNLPSTYESDPGDLTIVVYGAAGNTGPWRVEVRRDDASWDSHLTLWARRVGDGMGFGQVAGGQAYQPITGVDGAFFSGAGDRSSITLQFKLTGLSALVPAGTYAANLFFTVVNN